MMKIISRLSELASNTFAYWVILIAVAAFYQPSFFHWIAPYIPVLLGIIMYGMGLTLTLQDFKEVIHSPYSVLVGVLAQFIIMPMLAIGLSTLFRLPPEIAVGVILVGCCPGGTASNVITFLARGNTALSVTITSCSTLLAPILTPMLTYLLARKWLPVSMSDMFLSILEIVLIPIILGIITRIFVKERAEKATSLFTLISVFGIILVVAAVVSINTKNLANSGLLIFLIVILHNGLGLLLGYLAGKILKLPYPDQKAIAIEVGMQNSGLGAALATAHFSPIAALPSAIFSVWHNISGPLLATYWRNKMKRLENSEQKYLINGPMSKK